MTSAANRTSPVTRGKWVLENVLGAPPPNPPPGVETNIDRDPADVKVTSLRQRMELHRSSPACASCHRLMDPIGFSLENFDHAGKWRTLDGQSPIDATGVLVDGTQLDGPLTLRRALLAKSDVFASVFAEKLLTYALGRAHAAAGHAGGAGHRARRGAGPLHVLVVRPRRREEPPFQMRTKARSRKH